MTDQPATKLWDLIEGIRTCMLTASSGGKLESRPMGPHLDRDAGLIWFITELGSEKTREIEADGTVNLAFVDDSAKRYVSISGAATVLRDVEKQKKFWGIFTEAWLPEGSEAPNVGLIRVEPVEATYWDSPGGTLTTLFRVAVANITQTPPKGDDVQKVSFG